MILFDKNKRKKPLFTSDNLRVLQTKLEELAYEVLNSFQISPQKYYPKSKSGKYGKHPYGYFMISSINKIQIYLKIQNQGYIYNSFDIFKICTFELIEPEKRIFINDNVLCLSEAERKCKLFKEIHEEIEKSNI